MSSLLWLAILFVLGPMLALTVHAAILCSMTAAALESTMGFIHEELAAVVLLTNVAVRPVRRPMGKLAGVIAIPCPSTGNLLSVSDNCYRT